jgi:hypothetical protein
MEAILRIEQGVIRAATDARHRTASEAVACAGCPQQIACRAAAPLCRTRPSPNDTAARRILIRRSVYVASGFGALPQTPRPIAAPIEQTSDRAHLEPTEGCAGAILRQAWDYRRPAVGGLDGADAARPMSPGSSRQPGPEWHDQHTDNFR